MQKPLALLNNQSQSLYTFPLCIPSSQQGKQKTNSQLSLPFIRSLRKRLLSGPPASLIMSYHVNRRRTPLGTSITELVQRMLEYRFNEMPREYARTTQHQTKGYISFTPHQKLLLAKTASDSNGKELRGSEASSRRRRRHRCYEVGMNEDNGDNGVRHPSGKYPRAGKRGSIM